MEADVPRGKFWYKYFLKRSSVRWSWIIAGAFLFEFAGDGLVNSFWRWSNNGVRIGCAFVFFDTLQPQLFSRPPHS